MPAVVDPRLRLLLRLVFLLFALLVVNSVYLGGISIAEYLSQRILEDRFYLSMFLVHLALGLLLILPVLAFGIAHMRRAWRRPNRYAVAAGLGVFITALLLLGSGVLLTRFGFFEVNDPEVRNIAYWMHVVTPVLVAWLFVLHRLAGPRIHWRVGGYWAAFAGVFALAMLGLHLVTRAPAARRSSRPRRARGFRLPTSCKTRSAPSVMPTSPVSSPRACIASARSTTRPTGSASTRRGRCFSSVTAMSRPAASARAAMT
jgi:hypothetical protein